MLRGQDEPQGIAVLAELSSLHPNTVREHLDMLVRAGLASRARERPHGRGRPAWLYAATSLRSGAAEYSGLATALSATILRTSPNPRAEAERAGEEWGRALARQRGARPTSAELARNHAVQLLDDLGFEPHPDPAAPSAVRLTRCPLLDAARRNPSVVCSVHLGLLRGTLQEYGGDPTGTDVVPFAESGACLAVVPPLDLAGT